MLKNFCVLKFRVKIFSWFGVTHENFLTVQEMAVYELKYCVRGYHVYGEEWEAAIWEELQCEREKKNAKDPCAVAVVRHLPCKISRICSLFIKRKGRIRCQVVGGRRYSVDLPQGGLESCT